MLLTKETEYLLIGVIVLGSGSQMRKISTRLLPALQEFRTWGEEEENKHI